MLNIYTNDMYHGRNNCNPCLVTGTGKELNNWWWWWWWYIVP